MRALFPVLALALSCAGPAAAPPPAPTNTQAEVAAALAQAGRDAKDLERDARDQPAATLGLLGLTRGMRG